MKSPFVSGRFWLFAPLLAACGPTADPAANPDTTAQAVAVVCVEAGAPAPPNAVPCADPLTLECGSPLPRVVVTAPGPGWCASARLSVDPVTLDLGARTVTVRDGASAVCAWPVTVVDRVAPAVTPRVIPLWPPNHRMETIRVGDCVAVSDACDAAPRAVFTWAQVDEPDDATGDGNTSEDVQFAGCDAVAVRAERRGNGNGRVYSLGVRVTDLAGNVTDSVCQVVVAHDQSGRAAVDDAPARHVLPAADCR